MASFSLKKVECSDYICIFSEENQVFPHAKVLEILVIITKGVLT